MMDWQKEQLKVARGVTDGSAKHAQGESVAERFEAMHADGNVWITTLAAAALVRNTTPQQRKPLTDWVSVDDRLPEPYTEVLVTMRYRDDDLQVKTSEHDPDFEENNGWCFGSCFEAAVTHWMPMPEAAHGIKE